MIASIGRHTVIIIEELGSLATLFSGSLTALGGQVFRFRFRFRETVEQLHGVAVQSIAVIALSVTFLSLMLLTEFSFHMRLVLRQDSLVPAFSTVLMVRELGPVVTCLLLAARVGAGIAAEVGTMRVTEQLDVLRLLAVDPVEYLAVPRWLACLFAGAALSLIAVALAMLGGAFLASIPLTYSPWEYYNTMLTFTRGQDFMACAIKGAVFGSIIPMVAVHHGFRCRFGSQGVGEAATGAVVHSSVLIIAADFFLTYLLYAL